VQDICITHINEKTGRLSALQHKEREAPWARSGKQRARHWWPTPKASCLASWSRKSLVAARGGADPSTNSRLRLVVEQARKASMPKDTLERAIKKGSGTGTEAVHYEHVIYEGFAPHRVAVMVE